MAKGLFSQGVCLLTNGQTTIDHIRTALSQERFEIVSETPAQKDWAFGGPTLVLSYLPDVNGYVAVDVVNQPWPDSMGDPKKDPMIFAAWSMGNFGPFAFPGGLSRARQHAYNWEQGKTIPEGHRGFIRLRISYVFGDNKNAPILPKDYDPVDEMMFLSRAVLALLKAPGVLCYFNPNGEVLRDLSSFRSEWDHYMKEQLVPLPLWTNIRFYNFTKDIGFMDCVGNGQLEARDIEALYPSAKYQPVDIDIYLRNVALYQFGIDRELRTGETIDGPGERNLSWTMEVLEQGVISPPRRMLRLYPKASAGAVRAALASAGR